MEILMEMKRCGMFPRFINKSGMRRHRDTLMVLIVKNIRLGYLLLVFRLAHVVNGKVEYKEKFLTYFHVFVKGAFDRIKEFCPRLDNNHRIIPDRCTHESLFETSAGIMAIERRQGLRIGGG